MRWAVGLCLGLLGMLGVFASSIPPADAHALLRQSEPEDGAELQRGPEAVTITFTEEPEAAFSVIKVLDSSGHPVPGTGSVRIVPGQPQALRIALKPLPKGVYTVTWRVVSRVDGHVTGGTFAFGIGASPADVARTAEVTTPVPSPVAIPAKWALYAGLVGLAGSAWIWTIGTKAPPPGAFPFLLAAWLAAATGLAGLAQAQRVDAGADWAKLFGTALGRALWWRAIPLLVAGVAIVAVRAQPTRRWRRALIIVGVSAAAVMLVHVTAGHAGAGAGSWRWTKIAFQWAHFVAAGAWIGGLFALLIALRGVPDDAKATTVRSFSTGAGIMLGVIVITGLVRAVDEVGELGQLVTTTFGQLVLLKMGLLLLLAAFGAVNRYRHVPAAGRTLRGLRRIGGTELIVASVVLGVTGWLTGQVPPSLVLATRPAPALMVSANDFATSVRAQLEVKPGFPGPNSFVARVVDFDTSRPVTADRVSLRFRLASRPDIAPSTVELKRQSDGTYRSRGSNLSLEGQWTIVLLVERGINTVEVPLTLITRSRPQQVQTIRAPGQPTLYVIELPDKRSVQVYLDPERPGPTQVHATYFDTNGRELPIPSNATIMAASEGNAPVTLPIRRFGPGHFIADANITSGTWQLDITAIDPYGERLQSRLTIRL